MYTYMYLANTNTVHVYTCIIITESDSIQLFNLHVHVYTCIINTESDSIQLFNLHVHIHVFS